MRRIHVLVNNTHIELERLPGKIVIVLDVMFATTSIVTALEEGAVQVIPCLDRDAALVESRGHAQGSYVLAGERETQTLVGFVDPWPRALSSQRLRGKTLIYSTTNGTVALERARSAAHVYAAGLINGEATMRHIRRMHGGQSLLIVCSGSGRSLNLEDFYGAGYLASLFLSGSEEYAATDAAKAAAMFHDRWDALECLRRSRIGRIMAARNLADEVAYSAQKSICSTVAVFADGRVQRA